MNINKATILIIFGISGNLSKNKLLPAINQLLKVGAIGNNFKIIGITRQLNINIDNILENIENKENLKKYINIFSMDILKLEDYEKLSKYINDIKKEFNTDCQNLFYLAIPPEAFKDVVKFIGESSLIKNNNKLLLEKPFGLDLISAKDLIKYIKKYFSYDQIYRIDHYLAKETVQNLLFFKERNAIFRNTWNNKFIEKIEIIASEQEGINGRINFYEQTGALRDLIQSHLLQLAAIILMDSYNVNELEKVPLKRLATLKKLKIKNLNTVKRAQYIGYKNEVNNKNSKTETFVSLTLKSSDKKWENVPITLSTGKGLKDKITYIIVYYKKKYNKDANKLILQIQPNEEIKLSLWIKNPGYDNEVNCESLSFDFKKTYGVIPQGYEHVLFGAINSDHSLFVTNEEVIATWKILDPIQKKWKLNKNDLFFYKTGTSIEDLLLKNNFK